MARQTFQEIISSEKPTLVDFYAEWCGPCKTMSPIIEEIAGNFGDKLKVIKINTDKNNAVSAQYGIQGIPTFILFKEGKIIWRGTGAMPKQQIEQQIKTMIG
jgi:thioredoxin 1